MVWPERQAKALPAMLVYHLLDALLQPVPHWPYQHLAAPLGTPHDAVDHQVDGVAFVLLVHGYSRLQNNTERKAKGPFIPRLKGGGFLAYFL